MYMYVKVAVMFCFGNVLLWKCFALEMYKKKNPALQCLHVQMGFLFMPHTTSHVTILFVQISTHICVGHRWLLF